MVSQINVFVKLTKIYRIERYQIIYPYFHNIPVIHQKLFGWMILTWYKPFDWIFPSFNLMSVDNVIVTKRSSGIMERRMLSICGWPGNLTTISFGSFAWFTMIICGLVDDLISRNERTNNVPLTSEKKKKHIFRLMSRSFEAFL